MICKRCGCEQSIKNGKIRNKQRYKCKFCGLNFVEGDLREKVSASGKALAILLYCRGKASYGFIAKLFNVSSVAVMKWIKREASQLPEPEISESIVSVSFDEMWHFVNKKKRSYGSGGRWSAFSIEPSAGVSGIVLLKHSGSSSKNLNT
jgi:transposase-like protein